MVRSLPLAVLAFFIARPVQAELYTHWGSIDGNRTMLRLAGYPQDRPHFQNLSTHAGVAPNEAVMEQIDTWYRRADRGDRAGAGLYFASELSSSRQFGGDMLFVEFIREDGDAMSFPTHPDIKTQSDRAYTETLRAGLPLASRYNGSWHVMSRLPSPDDKVRVELRPPRADDVEAYFKQSKDKVFALSEASWLLQYELRPQKPERFQPLTSATDIFLRRLLFDRGTEFLIHEGRDWAQILTEAANQRKTAFAKNLSVILRGFHLILPQDSRTEKIVSRWLDSRMTAGQKNAADGFLSEEEATVLADIAQAWPSETRASRAGSVLQMLDPALVDHCLPRYLAVFDAVAPHLKGPTEETLREQWKEALKRSLQKKTGEWVIERRFAEQVLRHFGEKGFLQLVDHLSARYPGPGYQKRWPYLDEKRWLGFAPQYQAMQEAASVDPVLLQKFWHRTIQAHSADLNLPARWLEALLAMHYYYQLTDAELKAKLFPTLKRQVAAVAWSRFLFVWPRKNNRYFDPTYLLDIESRADSFEKMVLGVAEDFPYLVPPMLEGIRWYPDRQSSLVQFGLRDGFIPAARLSVLTAALKEKLKTSLRIDARTKYAELNKEARAHVSRSEFIAAYERAHTNIQDSLEFSKLSRIFVLVDPLLVSEDLRVHDARSPQHRFNESYIDANGTHSQPTWENFNEGWSFLAGDIQRKHAWIQNAKIDLLQHVMPRLRTILMTTYVDGTKPSFTSWHYYPESWNRDKYETLITDEQWKELELGGRLKDLEHYFRIERREGAWALKFLDAHSVQARFRGLFRTNNLSSLTEVMNVILSVVYNQKDPIERATQILELVPRLHPYENGNGRLARSWAAMELVQAGFPMPIGFPTNDFFLSRDEIRLHVRKAIELGRLWEEMLRDANRAGIAPEDFFQSRFRGSALEGLLHVEPRGKVQLESFVKYLEDLKTPPAWAREYMQHVDTRMAQMRAGTSGGIAQISELERHIQISRTWSAFAKSKLGLDDGVFACGPLLAL